MLRFREPSSGKDGEAARLSEGDNGSSSKSSGGGGGGGSSSSDGGAGGGGGGSSLSSPSGSNPAGGGGVGLLAHASTNSASSESFISRIIVTISPGSCMITSNLSAKDPARYQINANQSLIENI